MTELREKENCALLPACCTVADWPAMVSTPERGLADALAVQLKAMVALPAPDTRFVESQAAEVEPNHGEPAGRTVSETLPFPLEGRGRAKEGANV